MPPLQNYCTWCRRHGELSIFNGGHLKICRFYRCKSCNICDGTAKSSKAAPSKRASGFCRRCGNHGIQVLAKPWHASSCRYAACNCTRCSEFCVFCMFHDVEKYDVGQHAQACKFRGTCPCDRCLGERRRQGLVVKDSSAKNPAPAADQPDLNEPGKTQAKEIKNEKNVSVSQPTARSRSGSRPLCVFCKFHDQERYDVGMHAKFCKFRGECPCSCCVGERQRLRPDAKDSSARVEKPVEAKQEPRCSQQKKAQAPPPTTKGDTITIKNKAAPAAPQKEENRKRKGDKIVLPEPKRTHIEKKPQPANYPFCLYCLNHGWRFPMKSHHRQFCLHKTCRCPDCRRVRYDLKAHITFNQPANTTVAPPKKSVAVVPPNPRSNPNPPLVSSEQSANEPTPAGKASPNKPAPSSSLKDSASKSLANMPVLKETAPHVKLDKPTPTCEANNASGPIQTAKQSAPDKADDQVLADEKKILKDSSFQEKVKGEALTEEETVETATRENSAVCEVVVVNGEDFAVVDEVGADTSSDEITSSQETLPDLNAPDSTILAHYKAKQSPSKALPNKEVSENKCPVANNKCTPEASSVSGSKEISCSGASDINSNLNGTTASCTEFNDDQASTDRVVRESNEVLPDMPIARLKAALHDSEVIGSTLKNAKDLVITQTVTPTETGMGDCKRHEMIKENNIYGSLISSASKQSTLSKLRELEKSINLRDALTIYSGDEQKDPPASPAQALALKKVGGKFIQPSAEDEETLNEGVPQAGEKKNETEDENKNCAAPTADDIGNVPSPAGDVQSELDKNSTKLSAEDEKTSIEGVHPAGEEECETENEIRDCAARTSHDIGNLPSPASDVLSEVDRTFSTKPSVEEEKTSNEGTSQAGEKKTETEKERSELDKNSTKPSAEDEKTSVEGVHPAGEEECETENEIRDCAAPTSDDIVNAPSPAGDVLSVLDGISCTKPTTEDEKTSIEGVPQAGKEECETENEIRQCAAATSDDIGNALSPASDVLSEVDGTSSTKPSAEDEKTSNEGTSQAGEKKTETEKEIKASAAPITDDIGNVPSPAGEVLSELDGTSSTKPSAEDEKTANESVPQAGDEEFETEDQIVDCAAPASDDIGDVLSPAGDVLSEFDGTFSNKPPTEDEKTSNQDSLEEGGEECEIAKEIRARTTSSTVDEASNIAFPTARDVVSEVDEKTPSEASAQRATEDRQPEMLALMDYPHVREPCTVASTSTDKRSNKAHSTACAKDSEMTSSKPKSDRYEKTTPNCSTGNVSEIVSQTPREKPNPEQCEIASLLNELAEFGKNLRPYERYPRSANSGNIFTNLPEKPKAPEKTTHVRSYLLPGYKDTPEKTSVLSNLLPGNTDTPEKTTSVLSNLLPLNNDMPTALPVPGSSRSPRTNEVEDQVELSKQKKQATNVCLTCNKDYPSSLQLRLHSYLLCQPDIESKEPAGKCRECLFESSNQLALCDHESAHMGLVSLQTMFCLFGQVRQVRRLQKDGSGAEKNQP